jgi:3-phosphoshikimate 1-carboxyvinyltransferase
VISSTLIVRQARRPLEGEIWVPGDKSISHRALLLSAIARGDTNISGLLNAEDVAATAACLGATGVEIGPLDAAVVGVRGVGLRGLAPPAGDLNCGNSGTAMRLLLGILAGQGFAARLTGDESLSRRPMDRVARPLIEMGASVTGQGERCLPPVEVRGGTLRGISHASPVASAQVKSAVLLAGLYADGLTSVTEPYQSRDHTERMLEAFGGNVTTEGLTASVRAGELTGCRVNVPGDVSSAAFPLVAALLVPRSWVFVTHVGVNPTRVGVLDCLRVMGADIEESDREVWSGEPVATLTASSSRLRGCDIGAELVPRLIDELPVLCVAAALAEGTTHISGAQELRVKESDRIEAMATELGEMGARVTEQPDGLVIEGVERLRGAEVSGRGDHRVAMALAVAGAAAEGETIVTEAGGIATSFPGFVTTMRRIGVDIRAG